MPAGAKGKGGCTRYSRSGFAVIHRLPSFSCAQDIVHYSEPENPCETCRGMSRRRGEQARKRTTGNDEAVRADLRKRGPLHSRLLGSGCCLALACTLESHLLGGGERETHGELRLFFSSRGSAVQSATGTPSISLHGRVPTLLLPRFPAALGRPQGPGCSPAKDLGSSRPDVCVRSLIEGFPLRAHGSWRSLVEGSSPVSVCGDPGSAREAAPHSVVSGGGDTPSSRGIEKAVLASVRFFASLFSLVRFLCPPSVLTRRHVRRRRPRRLTRRFCLRGSPSRDPSHRRGRPLASQHHADQHCLLLLPERPCWRLRLVLEGL
ncbi:hypothetical protein BJY59DRAFT_555667 [Rhodotorula toruloides]